MKKNDSFVLDTLHTLLSSLEEAISVINTDGEMVFWNEAAEKTYHIKKEEIIGRNIRDFFEQEDIMNLKVLKTQQSIRDMYHIPRPDKHVLISASPIYNQNKELIGSMSVEKDISATIKLNEQLTSTSKELQQLKQQITQNHLDDPFNKIKGKNASIQQIIHDTKKVAKTGATILISGESGVGKELFAQAIHEESSRSEKPFIPINCGAIPNALFESELFGYEAGAYTGASKGGKPGKLELAEGGTLFLDEVGELPLDMQVKLLRALQEKEIYRIGGQTPIKVNVRIIAATNRILENMVSDGTFRSDLFYRLNVFSAQIPPLRERKDDIPFLLYDFLKELSIKYNKAVPAINRKTVHRLTEYHWPGNIRELRNLVERLVILHERSEIFENDIDQLLPQAKRTIDTTVRSLFHEKERLEKERILQTLQTTYGNKSITAKELGITRATLYKKMKKYGIISYLR
ncbi:sigma-54-dependent Fis family transcriptional regulator [Bacillus sp. AFS073361]|uniref:sigma-54 interaction domain-containing protein n=1 Tax=Bacillus sp. AFS073361 TaxID=2033511 RepID=UPI000BF89054|nr:sigma 54-interacting transcriptional regulator [Bacillus sp. AFS073361]PFP29147.1 sigma-54-dependent Fis family transcriptional regulator [Bacillus sp. AFS073361]